MSRACHDTTAQTAWRKDCIQGKAHRIKKTIDLYGHSSQKHNQSKVDYTIVRYGPCSTFSGHPVDGKKQDHYPRSQKEPLLSFRHKERSCRYAYLHPCHF